MSPEISICVLFNSDSNLTQKLTLKLTLNLTQTLIIALKKAMEKCADEYFSFSFYSLLRKTFSVKYSQL